MEKDLKTTLKEARLARGLSMDDLAGKLNVSKTSVSKWEKGTNTPRKKNIGALSEALGIPLNLLRQLAIPDAEGATFTNAEPLDESTTTGKRTLEPRTTHTQSVAVSDGPLRSITATPDPEWGDYIVIGNAVEEGGRLLLRVKTDRMSPRYKPGETVILQRDTPKDGDDVWIELHPANGADERRAILRNLEKRDGTKLTLLQHKPARRHSLDLKQVFAIYRVVPYSEAAKLNLP